MSGHDFVPNPEPRNNWVCSKCGLKLAGNIKPPADFAAGYYDDNKQFVGHLKCDEFIAFDVMRK